MAKSPIIQAVSVGKAFDGGQLALADVNFRVEGGEFVSVIGPSGCGKSTLLRMVAGLSNATKGELTVGGLLPEQARRGSYRVGFVFQAPTLLPWRNVIDNIRVPMELQGVPRVEQNHAVGQALQVIGLTANDARKFPRMLSGGMRMRVSLARALVTNPDVLLLDEPFASLHDLLRQQLNEDLLRIWSERRWTSLFVTHNVGEAVFLSQRVLVISGRPGTIDAEVKVPFQLPRVPELRASSEFARLTGEVSAIVRRADA